MSTINPTGRGGSIQLNTGTTTVRQAPRNDFGTHMRTGIAVGANQAGQAIGVAAPFVPGAAVVSAAVSGAGQAVGGLGRSLARGERLVHPGHPHRVLQSEPRQQFRAAR